MATGTKAGLRKEFLARRDQLTLEARLRAGAAIHMTIFRTLAWERARTVLTYVSIGTEVETRPILIEGLRLKKRMVVPMIHAEGRPVLSELRHLEDLITGAYHRIPEPSPNACILTDPSLVQLALVPGVAFDRACNRLGFGGGYFDRLLPQMKEAECIGLAYHAQITDQPLPVEPHDCPMDGIVTESEIIRRAKSA